MCLFDGLEEAMDETIEIGNQICFAIFLEVGVKQACLGVEFREIIEVFQVLVSAQERLLIVITILDLI